MTQQYSIDNVSKTGVVKEVFDEIIIILIWLCSELRLLVEAHRPEEGKIQNSITNASLHG